MLRTWLGALRAAADWRKTGERARKDMVGVVVDEDDGGRWQRLVE